MSRRGRAKQVERAQQRTLTIRQAHRQFAGPLPPPAVLEQYAHAFPECPERIVAMAEAQAEHRQKLERLLVESNCRAETRGQTLGFLLAAFVLLGGFSLLVLNKNVQGFSLIVGDAGLLIGAFVYGRHKQARERRAKAQLVAPAQVGTTQP